MPPRAALPLDLELDRDGAGRVDGLRGPEKCGASRAPPPDMGAVGSGAAGRTTLQRDEASCDLGGAAVLEELVGGTEGVLVKVPVNVGPTPLTGTAVKVPVCVKVNWATTVPSGRVRSWKCMTPLEVVVIW